MAIKYDDKYAEAWLRHATAGNDVFRQEYIYPYFDKVFSDITSPNARVLDVGCGWGEAIKRVPKEVRYFGVDPTSKFLEHIQRTHGDRNPLLLEGSLPSNLPLPGTLFDIVLCSMALHCVQDLKSSIENLSAKVSKGGKLVIIDFRDDAEPLVRKTFLRTDKSTLDYVAGLYALSPEVSVMAEAYFHKEAQIERILAQKGRFKKDFLGPLFVGYQVLIR